MNRHHVHCRHLATLLDTRRKRAGRTAPVRAEGVQ